MESKYGWEQDSTFSYSSLNVSSFRPPPRRRFYIPGLLRPFGFIFVFCIALALIGILELGARKLPHTDQYKETRARVSSLLDRRQITPQTVQTAPSPSFSTIATSPSLSTRTTNSVATTPSPSFKTIQSAATVTTSKVSVTSRPAVLSTTLPANRVSTTISDEGGRVEVESADKSDFVRTTRSVPTRPSSRPAVSAITTGTSKSASAGTTPSRVFVSTEVTSSTTEVISITTTLRTTDPAGAVRTFTSFIPSSTVRTFTTNIVVADEVDEAKFILTWPAWKTFVGHFLPVLLATIFRLFWTSIYAKVKLIEPLTQLARPEGANSIYAFYLSSNLTPDPIAALFKGHWFILWTSVVYFTVSLLGPLASEVIAVETNWGCDDPDPTQPKNPCFPRLAIDPFILRILEGLLAYIAIMTLTLMVMMLRMQTGVYSDPSSIASIASLVHHPDVLEDFRRLDPNASARDIKRLLGNRRYKLSEYQRYDGVWRYGLVPTAPRIAEYSQPGIEQPRMQSAARRPRRMKSMDLVLDVVFFILVLALLGIVVAYYKDGNDDAFNRFFNSMTFGSRFSLTAAATLFALNWKRIERETHTLSPYNKMSEYPTSARSSILLRRNSLAFTAFIPTLLRGHVFASVIAFVTILAEILVVLVASIPYMPGQIHLEFLLSSFTTMTILGIMLVAILALMRWKWRAPAMPRTPDTIAAVVSYVSESRMLEDLEGCEFLDTQELDNRVRGRGKRYHFGKRLGRDGEERWVVDEETSLYQ